MPLRFHFGWRPEEYFLDFGLSNAMRSAVLNTNAWIVFHPLYLNVCHPQIWEKSVQVGS